MTQCDICDDGRDVESTPSGDLCSVCRGDEARSESGLRFSYAVRLAWMVVIVATALLIVALQMGGTA